MNATYKMSKNSRRYWEKMEASRADYRTSKEAGREELCGTVGGGLGS
jgi:hypothetical protein